MTKSNESKPKGRPRKASTTIGIQKTAKVAVTRAIKSATQSISNPLTKVILVAALGALASYFIYKE